MELSLFSGDVRKYGLQKALTRQKKDIQNRLTFVITGAIIYTYLEITYGTENKTRGIQNGTNSTTHCIAKRRKEKHS